MKYLLILFSLIVSVSGYSFAKGCSSPVVCGIGNQAIAMMAATTGVALGCQNLGAVQSDFAAQFKRWKFCPSADNVAEISRSIGGTVCNTLVDFVIDAAAAGGIPASWECSPTATVALLKDAAKSGCVKIFH